MSCRSVKLRSAASPGILTGLLIGTLAVFSASAIAQSKALNPISASSGSIFSQILADFDAGRERLFLQPTTDMKKLDALYEGHYKQIDERTIDLHTISLAQISQLNDRGIFSKPKYVALVKDRLAAAAKEPTLDGALAATLQVVIVGGYKEDGTIVSEDVQARLIETLLQHPKLNDLLASDQGAVLVDALQMAPKRYAQSCKPAVVQIAALMESMKSGEKSGDSLRLAKNSSTYSRLVKQTIAEGQQRQAIRATISKFLAIMLAVPGGQGGTAVDRKFLVQFQGVLEGAAAKNVLIGQPAPVLSFQWASLTGSEAAVAAVVVPRGSPDKPAASVVLPTSVNAPVPVFSVYRLLVPFLLPSTT